MVKGMVFLISKTIPLTTVFGVTVVFWGLGKCNDLAGSERLNVSIGTVVPRFCALQGSMWVQWVKRQVFCGRDKWKRLQWRLKRMQVKQG